MPAALRGLFTGTSNADGVVQAPGASKLLALAPRAAGNGEDHDEAYEEWDARGDRRMIITAQLADDLAVLDTNWNSGLQVWNFGVPAADRGSADVRVRGFLQSDRGLYRPGDTVISNDAKATGPIHDGRLVIEVQGRAEAVGRASRSGGSTCACRRTMA